MPKSVLTAALLTLAAPAFAQTAAPAAPSVIPPPEFIQAAQGFGECIGRIIQAAPTTATPEAAAHQAVAGCATERTAMNTRFEAWVAGPGFPAEKRDMARAQYRAQLGSLDAQVTEQIRAMRPAATPTPTPAPTPVPTPAPKR